MLIAMAIIAIIVSMVYGSYAATSRSLDICDSRLTCSQRTDLILRLMARQLRCAYGQPTEPNATGASPAPAGRTPIQAAGELSKAGGPRLSKPRPIFLGATRNSQGDVLDFVTTGGLAGGPNGPGGLTRIRYRHDPGHRTLEVCSQPYIHSLGGDRSTDDWKTLSQQVIGVEIEFHDGRQWLAQWSSESNRKLPRAVRITLTVIDEEDRVYQCGTTVAIRHQAAQPSKVEKTR